MKKTATLIAGLMLLTVVLPSTAQVNLGVIGGLNIAGVSENVEQWIPYNKTYFGAGAVMDVMLHNHVSLVVEPMFIKKGGAVIDGPTHYEFNRSYLELPVLLKVSMGSRLRPYIIGGPTMGYLLSSKVGGWSGSDDLDGDLGSVTRKFEFGLTFGGGFSYATSFGTIFIESRYSLGLTNTSKGGTCEINVGSTTAPGAMSDEDVMETRGIQVLAGVTVPISK